MISTTGWQSLVERRAIAHLTLMYKIVHSGQVATIHVILLIYLCVICNLIKTVVDLPFSLTQSLNETCYLSLYTVLPQFSY